MERTVTQTLRSDSASRDEYQKWFLNRNGTAIDEFLGLERRPPYSWLSGTGHFARR
jgi:hypothetical protein